MLTRNMERRTDRVIPIYLVSNIKNMNSEGLTSN